jgi:predicted RNase H-like HicB family nuclease
VRYAIIIEKGKRNYSAFAPDVPGCAATGKTLAEVREQMKEALEFHFEGMLLHGEKIPQVTCDCATVDVDTAKIAKTVRRQRRASSA